MRSRQLWAHVYSQLTIRSVSSIGAYGSLTHPTALTQRVSLAHAPLTRRPYQTKFPRTPNPMTWKKKSQPMLSFDWCCISC